MRAFASLHGEAQVRAKSIASAERLDHGAQMSAVSLLFDDDQRPTAAALEDLAARSTHFSVSYDPARERDGDAGWLELLANGLTFDVIGLAPGASAPRPPQTHSFGIAANAEFEGCGAITLMPGPHLAGGARMVPVLRCLAWLGALLADLPGVRAVSWHSARSYNDPAFFRSGVLRWIEGGVFPALGLTALRATPENGLQSEGLAVFIGQEVRLAPELTGEGAEGAKIALRLINWLVENGRLLETGSMMGPSGEQLRIEPVENQTILKVSAS